jgi:basic membrane protein A
VNQAKCTTCGAGLTIKKGDKTCVCEYCQSTNIVENALALGMVEVDVTEDIKKLRANLTTFVQQNSIDELLRVSQKLLDWIPQDFVARYFFAYAKQQQNQPRFMYEFYQSPPTYTDDEIRTIVNHTCQHSELRDKRRVLDFLSKYHEDGVSTYLKMHKEREDKENHYANVPRDVFVCYSSYNVAIAERVVKELEADGNTCWISTRNLRPNDSENYWKNIENAIQNSTIVLVIGSEDSMRSKDVHQEIDFARQYQKKIIEFKIDEVPHNTLFKHVFNGIKWVNGSLDVNQNYINLLERIYEEKYQSPRTNEYDESSEGIVEEVSFDGGLEQSTLDASRFESIQETENQTDGIVLDGEFSHEQGNISQHSSKTSYTQNNLTSESRQSSSKHSLWMFSIIGLVLFLGFLVILGMNINSNGSLSNQTIVPNLPTTPTTPEPTTFRIAMITDIGDIDDRSYNQGTWEGVIAFAEANNISHRYYRPLEVGTAPYLDAITLAVRAGAEIVVTPGFLFESAIFQAQQLYPDVKFVLIDGVPQPGDYSEFLVAQNTVSILFDEHESGFLAGYSAVVDGYRELGYFGGIAVPAVVKFGVGFVAGANYAANELGVAIDLGDNRYAYLGTFAPSDDTKNAAAAWYLQGTEIIFVVAGGANFSVMAAAEEAGAKVIGVDVDQSSLSPTVVSSALKQLGIATGQALKAWLDGNFPGGEIQVKGVANDGVGLPEDFSRFNNPAETRAAYNAVYARIASGQINVPETHNELVAFLNAQGISTANIPSQSRVE